MYDAVELSIGGWGASSLASPQPRNHVSSLCSRLHWLRCGRPGVRPRLVQFSVSEFLLLLLLLLLRPAHAVEKCCLFLEFWVSFFILFMANNCNGKTRGWRILVNKSQNMFVSPSVGPFDSPFESRFDSPFGRLLERPFESPSESVFEERPFESHVEIPLEFLFNILVKFV